MSVSVFLHLPPSFCLSVTHTHSDPPTCQHTQFSTSSHPTMPQTCLAGQLDCATPQRDTALRDGDAGQGSTCSYAASCPSLYTPYACNTQCWLRLGYMPWLLSPEPPRRAALLEEMPNITGREIHGSRTPCPCPSVTPGSGHTDPARPFFNTQHLTSCLSTLHSGSFLSPHIWHKSVPPPAQPYLVVPRAQAGRDSCNPNSWGRGGGVGTVDAGAPCTRRDTPSSVQLLPGGGKERGLSLQAGVPGFLADPPTSLCPPSPHSPSLPGRKPVCEWRSLHPAALPGGCLPVSAWL